MDKLLEMLREEGCECEILVTLWTWSLIPVEHQRCCGVWMKYKTFRGQQVVHM